MTDDIIDRALAEDVGDGDATTLATVPETARARATICRFGKRPRMRLTASIAAWGWSMAISSTLAEPVPSASSRSSRVASP